MLMSPRGKQDNPSYTGVTGQIPKALKRQFAAKLAFYDDLDVNTALERLIDAWVTGRVEIGQPSDAPQPSPAPTKPKTPKASPPPKATEGITELASILEQVGISQNEFARRLDISSQTMSRYASGKRRTPQKVLAAARALLPDS